MASGDLRQENGRMSFANCNATRGGADDTELKLKSFHLQPCEQY